MAPASPLLRPAEEGDAVRLATLSGQLGYPVTVEAIRERLRLLEPLGDALVRVAQVEGQVVGWIQVGCTLSLEAGAQAVVLGLVVDEASRGRGIGAALVAEAEAWARARGLAALRVRTHTSRTDAHRFYAKLGFEDVKRQVVFRKNLGA